MQGNMSSLYDTYKLTIPKRMRVAEYLVFQFEHMNFNFDVVWNEDKLQDEYEKMMEIELKELTAPDGERVANRNERVRTKKAKQRKMK